MLWVKGELLTDIDAPGIDPTGQLERGVQPRPFDRREWFRRLLAHDGGTPLIGRAALEGGLCWLFLQRTGDGALASLSNGHSAAFRPVFAGTPDAGRQRAMLIAMARRLKALRPRVTKITFFPVPEQDGSAEFLSLAFRKAGWIVFVRQTSTIWSARIDGQSFANYWAARPARLRATFIRNLAKADFDTQIFTHFDPGAWEALESLLQADEPEGGIPPLLKEFAIAEGAAGSLRLGLCHVRGEIAAAQFWTVDHGIATIHLRACAADTGDLSPATVLNAALYGHVIDHDRVSRIESGAGNDDDEADWMDSFAPSVRIEAFNGAALAGLAGAVRAWLSRLVRRRGQD